MGVCTTCKNVPPATCLQAPQLMKQQFSLWDRQKWEYPMNKWLDLFQHLLADDSDPKSSKYLNSLLPDYDRIASIAAMFWLASHWYCTPTTSSEVFLVYNGRCHASPGEIIGVFWQISGEFRIKSLPSCHVKMPQWPHRIPITAAFLFAVAKSVGPPVHL